MQTACALGRMLMPATAVQEAIAQGLTEHPELPLSETLAMARVFDDVRGQIGLKYPWD